MNEYIITKEEGNANAFSNPPEGYVTIGTHRTGGGAHRWYTYAKKNSFKNLQDFMEEFKKHRTFPCAYYIIEGTTIFTESKYVGTFIGQKGRWVKAYSEVIGKRVSVKALNTFELRSRGDKIFDAAEYIYGKPLWERIEIEGKGTYNNRIFVKVFEHFSKRDTQLEEAVYIRIYAICQARREYNDEVKTLCLTDFVKEFRNSISEEEWLKIPTGHYKWNVPEYIPVIEYCVKNAKKEIENARI